MKPKKIGVVTGTRAEFGILEPLISALHKSGDFELMLYPCGMHMSEFYGNTLKDIKYAPESTVDMELKDFNSQYDMANSVSIGVEKFSEIFSKNPPDLLIVLGDRIEQFSAATAATIMSVPLAHLHGGEVSSGIDNILRNAITKMAQLHFAATNLSKQRILALGEEEWRVHNVGALGIDSLLSLKKLSKGELAKKYGLDDHKDWIIVLFHSDTKHLGNEDQIMQNLLDALIELPAEKIIIYPNADVGSKGIIQSINSVEGREGFSTHKSLPHLDFVSFMFNSVFMIGNSSSGLIEAPTLKLPVINVGTRQSGRESASNVVNVSGLDKEELECAIKTVLHDDAFQEKLSRLVSPYGTGRTCPEILSILGRVEVNEDFLHKTPPC